MKRAASRIVGAALPSRRQGRLRYCASNQVGDAALLYAALFGLAHLAGLREHTTFLSGTLADPAMRWEVAAFLGTAYLLLYFAFVLLVPILLLTAAAARAVHRWGGSERV